MNRHRFLSAFASSGAILLAGCTLFQDIEDVQVINNTSDEQTYTITITREATDNAVLNETTGIGPSEVVRHQNPIRQRGTYRISFETEMGSTGEYTWEFDDEYVALVIRILDSGISFEKLVS